MAEATLRHEAFRGQPAIVLSLPCGDSLRVLRHGAHAVSWVAGGRERLYLSPASAFDGRSAIRGGVPVCFPQFNLRGALPKHGFARNLPWALEDQVLEAGQGRLVLRLAAGPATRAYWPQDFEARLRLELTPGELQLTLDVRNTDAQPLTFTGALHTYFAVDDIAHVRLEGLQGQPEWDAVTDSHATGVSPLRFDAEFDRVYQATPEPLLLRDGAHALSIAQSPSWAQTVVWNPGRDKALADLPTGGHARMLCVEAAQVMTPITVAPGGQWQGWQRLSLR
ncbi:MAG: D-hexose-6-phosphate mutarotase [Acidovorax sp.]|uniref:D-hexose-6-phosphate mutarotase n=1 Tax=Acidovorax sp. TaxID=1872122 RepID=UPI0039E3DA38